VFGKWGRMRREVTVICLALVILASGIQAGRGASNVKTITKRLHFDLTKIEDNECLRIVIEGTNSFTSEPGKPILPMYVKVYTFPPGTRILSVSYQPKSVHTKRPKNLPQDAPEPIPLSLPFYKKIPIIRKFFDILQLRQLGLLHRSPLHKILNRIFDNSREGGEQEKDENLSLYPEKWLDYRVGYGLEDEKPRVFLSVYVYPVRYDKRRQELQIAREIDFTVRYTTGGTVPSHGSSENYELLIIAPSKFASTLQRLVQHKNTMNVPTKLVSLERDTI